MSFFKSPFLNNNPIIPDPVPKSPNVLDVVEFFLDPEEYVKKQKKRAKEDAKKLKKYYSTKERQRRNKGPAAFIDSFIDNVIRDMVDELAVGCLVYCDLACSSVEHTGIYIGSNKIVHLNGDGLVEEVSAKKFLDRLDGLNTAISIYAPCDDDGVVMGSKKVAKRAKKRIGEKLEYHLLNNNCHKFCYECLTGEKAPKRVWFGDLVDTAEVVLGADDWRSWRY